MMRNESHRDRRSHRGSGRAVKSKAGKEGAQLISPR